MQAKQTVNSLFGAKPWGCTDYMKIRKTSNAFEEKFANFKDLETDFAIFNADEVPQENQMEPNWVINATLFLNINLKMLTSIHWTTLSQNKRNGIEDNVKLH